MNPFQDFKTEIKLFLIVALVAVVLSVGGILAIQYIRDLNQSRPIDIFVPEFFEQQRKQQIQNESLMNVAGWQTYRNEEYGFEVRYPSAYNSESVYEHCRPTPEGKFVIIGPLVIGFFDSEGLNLSDYVNQYIEDIRTRLLEPSQEGALIKNPGSPESISLEGRDTIAFTSTFPDGSTARDIFIKRQETVIQFYYNNRKHENPCGEELTASIAERIISTFRFVDDGIE